MDFYGLKSGRRACMRTLPRFCVGMAPLYKQALRVYFLMASFLRELSGFIILPCENAV